MSEAVETKMLSLGKITELQSGGRELNTRAETNKHFNGQVNGFFELHHK